MLRLFSTTLLLLLCACASHETRPILATPGNSVVPLQGDGLLLFTGSVESQNPALQTKGCDLVLNRVEDKTEFLVPVKTSSDTALLSVPQGHYHLSEFRCLNGQHWDLQLDGQWSIESGKQYLAPALRFQISEDLGTIRHQVDSPKKTGSEFLRLLEQYPELKKSPTFSPYNNKVISQEMAKKSGRPSWSGSTNTPSPPSFYSCVTLEQSQNWLFLGVLRLKADYKDKKYVSSEVVENDNTYSAEFLACVKEQLEKFTPKHKGIFHYEISL